MKTKKAQAAQIFVYILAIVVAALIFLYGYKAISGFLSDTERINLVNFKTEIEKEIRKIAPDTGTVKKVQISIPSSYTQVCFVDYDQYPTTTCSLNALMCDAWKDQTQNIMLDPWAEIKINAPSLDIDGGSLCVPVINGKLTIKVEGLGKEARIEIWQ